MAKTLLPTWSDCVIGILVIVLFCVTLLLNILALHYTYSKIRKPSNKKIPHLLVGALSLSGLGIAVFEYPPFIASRFKGEWLYDSGVCNFVAFVVVLFGNLTICLVVLMSLERLGAIVFPFFYKQYVNFRKAVIILLFIVGYSVFLAILPLILDRIRLNVSTGVCTYAVDSYNTNTKIVVAVMVTHYIAAIIIMFVSNMVVVRTVSMLDRNTMSHGEYGNRPGERKQHSSHACLNFAKMVGVLAFCYTVCWTVILMRILLLYVYGWRNYYYDQLVIVLTTFDPLINHCVCLWIMRKYRDGYLSSMGSLMSCFKISDDGIWATTITRLSTISRRSTYSRASTRSSSRQSSKPYFYKQVPQNADNPQQELYPEGDDLPDQTTRNRLEIEEDKISDRKIVSDGKREWSEIIRELKAEKDRQDQEPSSSRGSEDIKVVEKGALHDTVVPGKRETVKGRWRNAFMKLKSLKTENESTNLENQAKFPEVLQGSILGSKDALATLHEKREDSSEQPSTVPAGGEDVRSQKEESSHSLQGSSSDDIDAKEQWTKILQKLNEEAKTSTSCPLPTVEKQAGCRDSDAESAPGKSSSLPELVREIKAIRTQEIPELIKDGATGKMEGAERQTNLPELLQDTSAKDDGTSSSVSKHLETSELQRKSMQDTEQSTDRKDGSDRAKENRD
ncbi:hypothetical protein QZH41_010537 [Actinostola sp. cb2023]|nr:hypothetical protein QZH41_010537 [Actinostola sp. cb2023]